jgi:hypothetical protein
MACNAIRIDNHIEREEQFLQVLELINESLKDIIICRYHFISGDYALLILRHKATFYIN